MSDSIRPPELSEIPADSVVSAVVAGEFGGPDPETKQVWLEERGADVIHAFHFQSWILVAARGEDLAAIVQEPGVEYRVGWVVVTGGDCTSR